MKNRKKIFCAIFLFALVVTIFSLQRISAIRKTSASIVKNYSSSLSQEGLSRVTYNGEDMFTAKATFFDYYSDSEVGTSSVPNPIDFAKDTGRNSYGKFNTKLLELMKYGDSELCPATYPLYQGRKLYGFQSNDLNGIYSKTSEAENAKSNFWMGANSGQIGNNATQGLIDVRLTYDEAGNSCVSQSNSKNGKKALLPYFNKKFLTENKFNNSQLSLGSVKENVAFPFRKTIKDGIDYYEFDSSKDTVRFNSNNQLDYLGENNSKEQVKDVYSKPGFFPYNKPSEGNSNQLNFAYGVKLEIPFNMTKDGKVDGKDIIFDFSGDDDVWVFVDGILALDIGGCHPKVSGSINFSKMYSEVSGVKNNKVAFARRNMGGFGEGTFSDSSLGLDNVTATYKNYKTPFTTELKSTLNNISKTHVLTMFYMERGMSEANMKLNFNLPEPTNYMIENNVVLNKVNKSFVDETSTVVKSEKFVFDVSDKTQNKASEIELKNSENTAYINEFDEKDKLLVQQNSLKNESRDMTQLYRTSWVLKDKNAEISKGEGYVVDDSRENEKLVLFENLDKKGVPKLTSIFTNEVNVSNMIITCKSEKYPNTEFEYVVTYSNIFGGSSENKLYEGEYIVYDKDGKMSKEEAKEGIIKLKDNERAVIDGIPVMTNMKVASKPFDDILASKICTQDGYKVDKTDFSVSGEIKNMSFVVEYTMDKLESVPEENTKAPEEKTEAPEKEITEAPEKENTEAPEKENIEAPEKEITEAPEKENTAAPEKENTETPEENIDTSNNEKIQEQEIEIGKLNNEEIKEMTEKDIPVYVQEKQYVGKAKDYAEDIEEVKMMEDGLDAAPKTSDESDAKEWLILMVVSLVSAVLSGGALVYLRRY